MEPRQRLSDRVDGITSKYNALIKRYGMIKPPATEAKAFSEEVNQLVIDIRETTATQELHTLDTFLVKLCKDLIPGSVFAEKGEAFIPYCMVGGAIGWFAGTYTQPSELNHHERYQHNRSFFLTGAALGCLVGGLFSTNKRRAMDEGAKFYTELFQQLENIINERNTRAQRRLGTVTE